MHGSWPQAGVQGSGWGSTYQVIRTLTSGNLEISLVVIQPGVIGLKKASPDVSEERVEEGQCDLLCVERLWMTGPMVMSYSRVLLVLWRVGTVPRKGCGIYWQKVCWIVSGKWDVSRVILQEFNISYTLLMVSAARCNRRGPSSFPGRIECTKGYQFWYCLLLVKNQWWERQKA